MKTQQTYSGASIFRLNLLFKRHQIRLVDMGMKYGLGDPRTRAQSQVVDKYHMALEEVYRAEREGLA